MTLPPEMTPLRVGYVALAGAPNVGKSTLVNRLVGQKISIVSPRPQTTRERVCGIVTDERMQAILVDIPGILATGDRFNQILVDVAAHELAGCDIVLHLRDPRRPLDPADEPVADLIRRTRRPVWLAWNKIDQFDGPLPPAPPGIHYEQVFAISGMDGRGLPELMAALAAALPPGPLLFDPEQVSDRDLRFMAGELVREKLFLHLGQEIPYGTAVEVEEFNEAREKTFIRALIVTEREAHKRIVIGAGGSMLKRVGQEARVEIEELLERPVFLELWVKVRPHWRRDERQLRQMGLKPPDSN